MESWEQVYFGTVSVIAQLSHHSLFWRIFPCSWQPWLGYSALPEFSFYDNECSMFFTPAPGLDRGPQVLQANSGAAAQQAGPKRKLDTEMIIDFRIFPIFPTVSNTSLHFIISFEIIEKINTHLKTTRNFKTWGWIPRPFQEKLTKVHPYICSQIYIYTHVCVYTCMYPSVEGCHGILGIGILWNGFGHSPALTSQFILAHLSEFLAALAGLLSPARVQLLR